VIRGGRNEIILIFLKILGPLGKIGKRYIINLSWKNNQIPINN
jgi:hypothetical protein